MKQRLKTVILAAALLALALPALGQDSQTKLHDALAWLNKVQVGFSPALKKDVPALQSILQRYFTDPDSLRASEEEIADAFLKTMPDTSGIEGRGGGEDRMKAFEALMSNGSSSSAAPAPKSKAHHPKPAPAKHTAPPKHPIPGIHSKPSFRASRIAAPGGKTIGAVSIAINGHSKTVVEILAGSPKLDVYQRAKIVAARMQRMAAANRLWWTMLKVSKVKGEYVVGVSRASDFVITADNSFAKEWGVSTQQLAKELVTKIRSAVDSEQAENFGGRAATPEDLRLAAIDLRQQGDALFKSSPQAAEGKYKDAISNDPTYAVPYLRLCDMDLARKDKDAARAILQSGLNVAEMAADQKAEIERKLKAIGS